MARADAAGPRQGPPPDLRRHHLEAAEGEADRDLSRAELVVHGQTGPGTLMIARMILRERSSCAPYDLRSSSRTIRKECTIVFDLILVRGQCCKISWSVLHLDSELLCISLACTAEFRLRFVLSSPYDAIPDTSQPWWPANYRRSG